LPNLESPYIQNTLRTPPPWPPNQHEGRKEGRGVPFLNKSSWNLVDYEQSQLVLRTLFLSTAKALPEISQCIWSACLKRKIHLATPREHGAVGERERERGIFHFLVRNVALHLGTLSDERVNKMQAFVLQNVGVVH
jgi:hypothetical protein